MATFTMLKCEAFCSLRRGAKGGLSGHRRSGGREGARTAGSRESVRPEGDPLRSRHFRLKIKLLKTQLSCIFKYRNEASYQLPVTSYQLPVTSYQLPVTSVAEIALKRFQSFHEKLKGFCSSRIQFEKHVEVNMTHITHEGLKKNPQRLALVKQDIAAVIQQGKLNSGLSNAGSSLEVAIEGQIRDFEWVDYKEMRPHREAFVQIRIIVRERKPKNLVVTAYVLNPPEGREFVEVNREIW